MRKYLFVYFFTLISALLPQSCAYSTDYNILDFGASTDPGDDRFAIQSAIFAASTGDRVIIPAGTFQVSSELVPRPGISIVGAGRDNSTLEFVGTSPVASMISMNGNGINDVELAHFTLDGNGVADNATQNALRGIFAQSTSGHHIHNMRIRDFGYEQQDFNAGIIAAGIRYNWQVTDTRIHSNEILNIGVDDIRGTAIRGNTSGSHYVVDNVIQNVGRTGIHFANSPGITVQRNKVMESGMYNGPVPADQRWAGDGLSIELFGGSNNSVVEDNSVDRWLSIASGSNTAVRRNTIQFAANQNSTDIETAGLELAKGDNNIFTDNFVGTGSKMSLLVVSNVGESVSRVFVGRNTFSEGTGRGAQIHANAGSPVRRVYFYDNDFVNAQGTADDPTRTYSGVRLLSNSSSEVDGVREIVFEDNRIIDNTGDGVLMDGGTSSMSELAFYSNTISGNTQHAFDGHKTFDSVHFDESNMLENNGGAETALNSTGFDNTAPVATIVGNLAVSVGSPVDFNINYADDESTVPDQVLWDFDEGLPVLDMAPTITFEKAGLHTVTLLAWDNDGRASRHTIEVDVLADFDKDSDVDGADFLTWQRDDFLGQSHVSYPLAQNLDEWALDYGMLPSPAATQSVPEPTGAGLLFFAVLLFTASPRGQHFN